MFLPVVPEKQMYVVFLSALNNRVRVTKVYRYLLRGLHTLIKRAGVSVKVKFGLSISSDASGNIKCCYSLGLYQVQNK